ncbi:MAG: hypothetical protein IKR81_11190 [Victivallales bacterium]|nr:hypothetical protein [Victivallales bacterium]
MSNRKLLVGASIPTGLKAVKDFEAMKLGEIVLMTLPDDAAQAAEVMRYCRERGIYVMLGEIVHRGGDERWRYFNMGKDELNKVFAEAGDYYLGRYTIGEAGGIMYWPKEYTIKRAVKNYTNLPPAKDVVDAKQKYIDYLKGYIDREERDIANGPLLNVDSSMLFKYQAEAGIDYLTLEMFPGSPLRMFPAIRGCARAMDKYWGVHIAIGCYGGFAIDGLWMKRWRQSLYLSYLVGCEFIFPESGYYAFGYQSREGAKKFPFDCKEMKDARAELREFVRFHKIHPRPSNNPRVKMAVIFGQYDGCPGLWNKYAWGQYESGNQWKDSDAERSWEMTDVLTTRENPYSELQLGENSFSGNPPYGQYDILPAEAPLEVMQQYSDIVFLGYNLMDSPLYAKLVAYVKAGGNLLMWLPHCNVNPARSAACRSAGSDPRVRAACRSAGSDQRDSGIQLFNNGDLSELFGVKITGRLEPNVVGVKSLGNGVLPIAYRGISRDPVMIGDITCATVELTSKEAIITAGFTGVHGATVELLEATPALIEHSLGKGKARLVPAFDYPGAPGMRLWAEHLLRNISLASQGDIRLLSSDSVRYAVYDAAGYSVLYALNTEFDVTQSVKVMVDGVAAEEATIPASSIGVFFIREGLVIHPELKETAVTAWNGGACTLVSLADQKVAIANTTAVEVPLTLNGATVVVPANDTATIACAEAHGDLPNDLFTKDYMVEPPLVVTDTRLPY